MLKSTLKGLAALATTCVSLSAGSVADDFTSPTPNSEGFQIGAPHLEFFTRSQSDTTNLPGYFIGNASYEHQFASDFDSLPGDVSSDEFFLFGPLLPLNYNDWHLISVFLYTQTQFETSTPNLIPNSTLHSLSVPIVLLKEQGDEWVWGAMVMPSWNGDFDASDNSTIATAAGVGYKFSDDFRFLAGAYYSHTYGNDFFIPAVQLIYRPCKNVEAYILGNIGGVSYSVNEDWFLGASARFTSPTWKVQADAAGPERTVNVPKINLALRSEHRLYKNIWGNVSLGYSFARSLTVEDMNNNTLSESDIKAGPFATVGLNYRF